MTPPAKIVVISGPSGSGKTTIIKKLLSDLELSFLQFSKSTTTRNPRKSEVHGVDYYFIDKKQFLLKKKQIIF